MVLNLKLIFRLLYKVRSYAILNIIGLSIGFACSFMIILWVKNEFSFDRHLPFHDRTYRLTFETARSGNRLHFARCWEPWIAQMPGAFPQIEELVRLSPYRHTAIKTGDNKFYSDRIFATDSNYFKVFGTEMIAGDPDNALKEPYSAIISSSVADRCFGKRNPIGQTLLLSGEYDTKMSLFTVKGVMNDSPASSHIHIDILTSFADPSVPPTWAYVYLLLNKRSLPGELLSQIPSFINNVTKASDAISFTPYLQKITDIHLRSDKDREVEQNGNITSVYLFILTGLLLLLVSLTNYFNLNKARLMIIRRQLIIQKLNGSGDWSILLQSLIESVLIVLASTVVACILLGIAAKPLSILAGYSLFEAGTGYISSIWIYITAISFTAVITGLLPVLIFITGKKISINDLNEEVSDNLQRRGSYGFLMVWQFFLAVILLIAAITINKQKEFILSGSMGEMSPDIITFRKLNWEVRGKYTSIRDRALRDPLIKSITATMEEPSGETADALQVESAELDEAHRDNPVYVLSVEDNFLEFFNIPLVAGRNFSPFRPDRKGEDYILNETALKKLGWTAEEAIGRPFNIRFGTPDIFYGGSVVGVARDFNYTTVKQEIKPYVLFQKPIFYLCIIARIDINRKEEALMHLRDIWEDELPDYPFQYEFLGDLYRNVYRKEITQAGMTSVFSVLALLIVCLGLYSVASLFVARRIKEIGIRKVNGAGVAGILIMLNKSFVRWFVMAYFLACPVGWYAMNRWLQNFVYKAGLRWWIFIASGLIVLAVVLVTVSLKSWKAASRNPVDALRYE